MTKEKMVLSVQSAVSVTSVLLLRLFEIIVANDERENGFVRAIRGFRDVHVTVFHPS